MKKVILLFSLFWMTTLVATAQPDQKFPAPQQLTPKEIAEHKTAFMEEELGLDYRQRKQVYKLYLKQAKAMQSKRKESGSFSGGRPSGPPPSGGRGPGGPGGSGRPPASHSQESEKDIAKRETKMKKILTPGQYEIWLVVESELRQKEKEQLRKEEQIRMFSQPK